MEGKNSQRSKALIHNSIRFRILSAGVYTLIILVMKIMFPYLFGHKVIGHENLKNMHGGIVVSNHCTYLDPGFIGKALYRKKIYFSILEKTIEVKGLGFFLRCLHGFPLPEDRPMDIAVTVKKLIEKKALVHFFPEGVLYDYNQEIKEFHAGPFYFALKNNAPVFPVANVLKKRIIMGKTLKPPWVKVITIIGSPIYPPEDSGEDCRRLAANYAEFVRKIMQEMIDENNGDKEIFNGKIIHRV